MDPTITTIMTIATILTVILGAVLTIKNIVAPIWRGFKKTLIAWEKFLEDWNGERYDDGRENAPGVIARLEKLESGLRSVKIEVKPNGGKSLKDVVNRIETRLEEGNQTFESLDSRITRIEGRIE